MRSFVFAFVLSVCLSSFVIVVEGTRIAEAWNGTVYIRADGSVDPMDAPLQKNGDIYVLTGSILGDTNGIVIERNGVTLDGMGYSVQSEMSDFRHWAIFLNGRSGVTIKNFIIDTSMNGILLNESLNVIVVRNEIVDCAGYGMLMQGSYGTHYMSANNSVSGNRITRSSIGIRLELRLNNSILGNEITDCFAGIELDNADQNTIMENDITNNDRGIWLQNSLDNIIVNNKIERNGMGIHYHSSSGNIIYNNSFENNATQIDYNMPLDAGQDTDSVNTWDSGYPRGGNYWGSCYSGIDSDNDGIGDTPYVINVNNHDNYPLMNPYIVPELPSFLTLTIFMIAILLAIILYRKRLNIPNS